MVQTLTYEYIESFRRARHSRDPQQIEPFLDDHVDWLLTGPVELLHFCGQRRGKAEVLNCLAQQHSAVLGAFKVELATLVIDGDRAATLSRMIGIQRSSGRTVCYNQAQFMQFRDSRIVEYRGIIDSFNAAEQIIGHSIPLSDSPRAVSSGDLIAI